MATKQKAAMAVTTIKNDQCDDNNKISQQQYDKDEINRKIKRTTIKTSKQSQN